MASEPNFAVIAQCLDGIKHEVGLLPNIIPLTAAMFRQEMQLTLGTILSELRTEIAAMRAEMGEMRAEMGAEIGQLRAEMGQLQVGAGQFRAEPKTVAHSPSQCHGGRRGASPLPAGGNGRKWYAGHTAGRLDAECRRMSADVRRTWAPARAESDGYLTEESDCRVSGGSVAASNSCPPASKRITGYKPQGEH
ncbi:uncharacterized protein H6S33_007229 [Morchella sextelata]|uniref:uncharacterized protein n=1 Tax=Morchella sextelata TaxID=1174677 RepID=UPI001D049AFB|nr:uncharacterized protein H6S33_007229 [Morchella sextelata]KAH0604198.1 hypothetical protein H6S33_007229 [Morchella sextelata]